MQKTKKKTVLSVVGMALVVLVMALLWLVNTNSSNQSSPAFYPDVYFEGQYRIGSGDWKNIEAGQHIPASQGDVTLKGRFHLAAPDGEYLGEAGAGTLLAFYVNHIHITVQEQGQEPYINDVESEYLGNDLCGEYCIGYELITDEEVTLTFHNRHRFGNENAIDDFLQDLSVYAGTTFEKDFEAQGDRTRDVGLIFVIVSLVVLGTALFSFFIHFEGSGKVWLVGLCVLFAGGYFVYSAKGVFFWSDLMVGNTTILGICMMLYMLCVCALITAVLRGKLRKIAAGSVAFLGAGCVAVALCCMLADTLFYDTWLWWVVGQSVVNAVLIACVALNFSGANARKIAVNIGAAVLLLGFEADVAGTAFGWWQGGLVSKYIFVILFVVLMVLVWQIIPRNINAVSKAKEMEAEQKVIRAQLQEHRIAVMISQIQPHFIYNTLGTIQQLCKENPEQASTLVRDFSVYLRGNFSELDNTNPIRFLKELEHVRCYTDIELIRFPDMTVHYDIQTEEFLLPALSVQPLVENAIKHGLMGLEEGGTVTVASYETPTHYCVKVTDDGVGFDETAPRDDRKHVGIRNVRERLQVMCGGSLTVESQKGKGTIALIQIPKEGKKE